MEITKAFSLRINELIDETGLSLENLSRAAGVMRFYIVSSQRAKQSQASFHQGAFKSCGLFQVLAVFYAGTGGMQFLCRLPKTELPAFSDRLRELIEAKELKFFLMKKSWD